MSVRAAAAPAGARTGVRASLRAVAAERSVALSLAAFVASRLIAMAAGAAGVLRLGKFDHVAAAQTLHSLGPVGNVLVASADRFDAGYYLAIARQGFGPFALGRTAFFPLYPMLIKLLGSSVAAGMLISAASFIAALVLLHRLTERELGRAAADTTVLLLCFAPLSFFFTAVYSESLFLLLSVATVFAARTGRWRLACGLAALATLTRSTGILLALPLAIMHMRGRGRRLDPGLAWLAVLPAALGAYMLVLWSRDYPLMAVFSAQRHWHRVTVGPVLGALVAVYHAVHGAAQIVSGSAPVYAPTLNGPFSLAAEAVILLAVLVAACLAARECLRRLPLHYGAYAIATILLCLSSPWSAQPLWSFDRFTLTMFPLWMAAGAWLSRRPRLRAVVLVAGGVLLAFYALQFSRWAFVA